MANMGWRLTDKLVGKLGQLCMKLDHLVHGFKILAMQHWYKSVPNPPQLLEISFYFQT